MSDIKELAGMLKELEEQIIVCMKCGMCQAVCPLFDRTGKESDVARGKLALLDGISHQILTDPNAVNERLNRCLLCGSCAANCPSGVRVLEIFIKARAILAGYMGLSPVKKLIFRGMLAHPGFFDRIIEWGARFQKIFTTPVNDIVGTSCARVKSPILQDRHLKNLAPVPFHKLQIPLDTMPGKSGIRVGFFTGCLIDKIYPSIAQASIKVLEYHGVGIYMPQNQGCCGIPAISSGDTKTFRHLMDHNLNLFDPEKFDYLITACATCTSTIKKIWQFMAEKKRVQAARKISEKTMDINEFLVSKLKIVPASFNKKEKQIVTYHDPCHLKKSLGVWKEPRAIISANPNYDLKEMPQSDWCCGMGGSFNLQYYDISAEIGRKKRENIVSTGCSVFATGCPACMTQIADMLSQAGDRIIIKHPVEIYAETIP